MKLYWSYKSVPELSNLPSEEAERRFKAALLRARFQHEDKSVEKNLTIVGICGVIGYGAGMIYGFWGQVVGAGLGTMVGAILSQNYERLTMNSKAVAELRKSDVQHGVQADRP